MVNYLLCLPYRWNLTEGNRPLSIYVAQTLESQKFSVDCKTIKIGHLITRIKNRFPNQKINYQLGIADRLGTIKRKERSLSIYCGKVYSDFLLRTDY